MNWPKRGRIKRNQAYSNNNYVGIEVIFLKELACGNAEYQVQNIGRDIWEFHPKNIDTWLTVIKDEFKDNMEKEIYELETMGYR